MRTNDLRLLTAALMLLLTGAFLTTPAKADQRPAHCALGRRSSPSSAAAARDHGTHGGDHTARTARWTAPTVHYRLTARYAAKGHRWRHRHTGQDFAVPTGTPVYAVGPGRVVAATCGDEFGNQVVLHHPDGYYTQYGHLSVISVRPGQWVSAGQLVGAAGATGNADGPHLHFEVRTAPRPGSAVPPLPWLRHHGVPVPAQASPAHPRPRPRPAPSAPPKPSPGGPDRTGRPGRPGGPVTPPRPAPTWHGRPDPQAPPPGQWNPATPWDPTALWDTTTR
ncbi:M23 family metallopeptidase [Streptomyces sp. NPDC051987]|uniref:M23 family metallopeptidase n=1 Tax=Streptomyces sp. NPDC051987 TaxID=3155808 RepID=UPI003417A89C